MGSIYARGERLYVAFKDGAGNWHKKATGYSVGQESLAREALQIIERNISAAGRINDGHAGAVTLARFAEKWLEARPGQGISSAKDERSHFERHVLPVLGDLPIADVRPRHVRDFVRDLRKKLSVRKKLLAPRTIRNVFGVLHRIMHDAVVEELIQANPCVLKKGELPKKADAVPGWRDSAVFTRAEVESLLSDERIPEDRRVFYAIMFLGGLRFGEVAALHWSHYEAAAEPLGRLQVLGSYSTKHKKEKATKTERPRRVPVHPALASLLASWKLGGWKVLVGRNANPEDLIVPSREGANRSNNHMLKRFHEDLTRLGLRERRMHDARRTLASLALDDGAHRDVLRWITHGPPGDILGAYTTLDWKTLCSAISCVQISLHRGEVIPLAKAVNSRPDDEILSSGFLQSPAPKTEEPETIEGFGLLGRRGGRDLNPRPPA